MADGDMVLTAEGIAASLPADSFSQAAAVVADLQKWPAYMVQAQFSAAASKASRQDRSAALVAAAAALTEQGLCSNCHDRESTTQLLQLIAVSGPTLVERIEFAPGEELSDALLSILHTFESRDAASRGVRADAATSSSSRRRLVEASSFDGAKSDSDPIYAHSASTETVPHRGSACGDIAAFVDVAANSEASPPGNQIKFEWPVEVLASCGRLPAWMRDAAEKLWRGFDAGTSPRTEPDAYTTAPKTLCNRTAGRSGGAGASQPAMAGLSAPASENPAAPAYLPGPGDPSPASNNSEASSPRCSSSGAAAWQPDDLATAAILAVATVAAAVARSNYRSCVRLPQDDSPETDGMPLEAPQSWPRAVLGGAQLNAGTSAALTLTRLGPRWLQWAVGALEKPAAKRPSEPRCGDFVSLWDVMENTTVHVLELLDVMSPQTCSKSDAGDAEQHAFWSLVVESGAPHALAIRLQREASDAKLQAAKRLPRYGGNTSLSSSSSVMHAQEGYAAVPAAQLDRQYAPGPAEKALTAIQWRKRTASSAATLKQPPSDSVRAPSAVSAGGTPRSLRVSLGAAAVASSMSSGAPAGDAATPAPRTSSSLDSTVRSVARTSGNTLPSRRWPPQESHAAGFRIAPSPGWFELVSLLGASRTAAIDVDGQLAPFTGVHERHSVNLDVESAARSLAERLAIGLADNAATEKGIAFSWRSRMGLSEGDAAVEREDFTSMPAASNSAGCRVRSIPATTRSRNDTLLAASMDSTDSPGAVSRSRTVAGLPARHPESRRSSQRQPRDAIWLQQPSRFAGMGGDALRGVSDDGSTSGSDTATAGFSASRSAVCFRTSGGVGLPATHSLRREHCKARGRADLMDEEVEIDVLRPLIEALVDRHPSLEWPWRHDSRYRSWYIATVLAFFAAVARSPGAKTVTLRQLETAGARSAFLGACMPSLMGHLPFDPRFVACFAIRFERLDADADGLVTAGDIMPRSVDSALKPFLCEPSAPAPRHIAGAACAQNSSRRTEGQQGNRRGRVVAAAASRDHSSLSRLPVGDSSRSEASRSLEARPPAPQRRTWFSPPRPGPSARRSQQGVRSQSGGFCTTAEANPESVVGVAPSQDGHRVSASMPKLAMAPAAVVAAEIERTAASTVSSSTRDSVLDQGKGCIDQGSSLGSENLRKSTRRAGERPARCTTTAQRPVSRRDRAPSMTVQLRSEVERSAHRTHWAPHRLLHATGVAAKQLPMQMREFPAGPASIVPRPVLLRAMSGTIACPNDSGVAGVWNFRDFVSFSLAQADRMRSTSALYWLRLLDSDHDGVVDEIDVLHAVETVTAARSVSDLATAPNGTAGQSTSVFSLPPHVVPHAVASLLSSHRSSAFRQGGMCRAGGGMPPRPTGRLSLAIAPGMFKRGSAGILGLSLFGLLLATEGLSGLSSVSAELIDRFPVCLAANFPLLRPAVPFRPPARLQVVGRRSVPAGVATPSSTGVDRDIPAPVPGLNSTAAPAASGLATLGQFPPDDADITSRADAHAEADDANGSAAESAGIGIGTTTINNPRTALSTGFGTSYGFHDGPIADIQFWEPMQPQASPLSRPYDSP